MCKHLLLKLRVDFIEYGKYEFLNSEFIAHSAIIHSYNF